MSTTWKGISLACKPTKQEHIITCCQCLIYMHPTDILNEPKVQISPKKTEGALIFVQLLFLGLNKWNLPWVYYLNCHKQYQYFYYLIPLLWFPCGMSAPPEFVFYSNHNGLSHKWLSKINFLNISLLCFSIMHTLFYLTTQGKVMKSYENHKQIVASSRFKDLPFAGYKLTLRFSWHWLFILWSSKL
jgi:hypothetical protein